VFARLGQQDDVLGLQFLDLAAGIGRLGVENRQLGEPARGHAIADVEHIFAAIAFGGAVEVLPATTQLEFQLAVFHLREIDLGSCAGMGG
jgi:hypothetical protein